MARNNPKPGEKPDWVPDDTSNIVVPGAGRKTSGWLFEVKPPAENFNWFWNLISRFTDYFGAQVEDWIVIDSDADEGDYATLVAYLADSPAAGDRILIKEDQTFTAQVVIPLGITLKVLDGVNIFCATNIATSVMKFGGFVVVEGLLNLLLNHTGTTAKGIELDADHVIGKIAVKNISTGILTTAFHINANKTGNQIKGFVQNTGGGTVTNVLVDNSTEDSNILTIVDESTNDVIRSKGARSFANGLEFDLDSDADGDIYYRDAGILKRLAKGANDTYLRLVAGIPSWSDTFVGIINTSSAIIAGGGIQTDGANTLKTKIIDIGDWNMDLTANVNIAHGLTWTNIRSVDIMIRDDGAINFLYPIDHNQGGVAGYFHVDATNIAIDRVTSGLFDNVNYDATSYNRGWITITYIA